MIVYTKLAAFDLVRWCQCCQIYGRLWDIIVILLFHLPCVSRTACYPVIRSWNLPHGIEVYKEFGVDQARKEILTIILQIIANENQTSRAVIFFKNKRTS